jgi:hypothetical protein
MGGRGGGAHLLLSTKLGVGVEHDEELMQVDQCRLHVRGYACLPLRRLFHKDFAHEVVENDGGFGQLCHHCVPVPTPFPPKVMW